jgi:hypothetical protein
MCFRDLHTFNTTMLAKQCWGLMEQPDSLGARVPRASYYPDGNLLKAKLKSGSSYTWQSVIHGLHAFNRGYICRVGEGDQINIREDAWIPTSPTRKVYTPRAILFCSRLLILLTRPHDHGRKNLFERIFGVSTLT